jgi:hypothetical protein
MRKGIIAVFLCAVIVVALSAYILIQPTRSQSLPKIGVFYYVWYNGPDDLTSWANHTKIVDKPILGYYNSCDPTIIKQHLVWMQDLGIDFVIISWWGFYDDYGNFTDNATKQVFETAQNINSTLKFAVIVEPFNKTGNPTYDYSTIDNHIYNDLVLPYSSIYYNYNGQPLICFFNDPNNNPGLTPNGKIPYNDPRFSTIIVGDQNYVQWAHTDLDSWTKSTIPNDINETSVTPRFDDSRFRIPYCVVDPNLTEGVYDQEWTNATLLWNEGKSDTIMISSWNEYVERTEIEPHYDATAINQSTNFLYDKTKYYINQISSTTSASEYFNTLGVTTVIITMVTTSYFILKIRKPKKAV